MTSAHFSAAVEKLINPGYSVLDSCGETLSSGEDLWHCFDVMKDKTEAALYRNKDGVLLAYKGPMPRVQRRKVER